MKVDWQLKVWGRTRCIHESDLYSIHELETKSGAYCSLHYHQKRANRFIVKSGSIQVIEMYGPVIKRTTLYRDNVHDVPSLVPHMFVVLKQGIVIEEYYSDRGGSVKNDDIIRIVEGGELENWDDMCPNIYQRVNELPSSLLNNYT